MRIIYGSILVLFFSITFAPCKVITLYLLCFIFLIISLLLSFISLSLGIALSTNSIEICVLSLSLNGNSNIFFYTFCSRLRAKKSNKYLYCKKYMEINTILNVEQLIKVQNSYCNIGKIINLIEHYKCFCIFGKPIVFCPIVQCTL